MSFGMTPNQEALVDKRSDKYLAGKRGDFSVCAAPADAIQLAAHQWQEFLEFSPDPM